MYVPKVPHIRPPKIHWRAYLERKMILLTALVAVTYVMETYFHIHESLVHQAHELAVGVLAEHIFFGIPLEG